MDSKSIYRSREGIKILHSIYDRQLESLKVQYRDKYLDTRYGTTHVIVTGNQDGKPLIVMHGGNSNAPDCLEGVLPLAGDYSIHAIDTIGQPGKSDETRLSSSDLSYGYWLLDVLDGLEFEKSMIFCGSFSAGIVLRLAAIDPGRIDKVLMVVPSGIANGSKLQQIKLFLPYLRYRLRSNRQNLVKLASTIMMRLDEKRLEFLEAQFKHYKTITEMPRPVKNDELQDFTSPVMIYCTEGDIMFPAKKVIPRAKKVIPNLVHSEIVKGLHEPSQESFEYIMENALEFFS